MTATDAGSTDFDISDLSPESLALEPGASFELSATVTNSGDEDTTQQVLAGVAESEAAFDDALSGSVAEEADITITLNNQGSTSWQVLSVDGASLSDVAESGSNPTLFLEVGQRYTIDNQGWVSHPFVLADENNGPVLSQVHNTDFEDDPDVDWVHDGERCSFTLTPSLAEELSGYNCATHPQAMRGDIETRDGDAELLLEGTLELSLDAGDAETVTFDPFETDALDPGEYVVGVMTATDSEMGTLELDPVFAYVEEDGTVGFDGVRDAIDDWRTGDTDVGVVSEVIDVWRSG